MAVATASADAITIDTPPYRFMATGEWKDLAKDGDPPADVVLRKTFTVEVVRAEIDTERRRIPVIITTDEVDRENDTIAADGWDLTEYRRNPVVLWAHDYHSLPIAKAVELTVEPGRLRSVDEFASAELYGFADTVYQPILGGYISATSVGFRPLTWAFDEERVGFNFLTHEMLEHSWVPIPANAGSLVEARSAGIDVEPIAEWAEKFLDTFHGEAGLWLPEKQVHEAFNVVRNGRSVHLTPRAEESGDDSEGKGADVSEQDDGEAAVDKAETEEAEKSESTETTESDDENEAKSGDDVETTEVDTDTSKGDGADDELDIDENEFRELVTAEMTKQSEELSHELAEAITASTGRVV